MIQRLTSASFTNALKYNNLQNTKNHSKPVSFGEVDEGTDYGDESYDGREEIESKYRQKMTNLARFADDIGMSNKTYWERRNELENDLQAELDEYDFKRNRR